MKNNKEEFCVVCAVDRELAMETKSVDFVVRGETVSVDLPITICPDCGAEEVDEEFGRLGRTWDGSSTVVCFSCGISFPNFVQYRHHVDHGQGHRRRSAFLLKRSRRLIVLWERHRLSLRRELGLEP